MIEILRHDWKRVGKYEVRPFSLVWFAYYTGSFAAAALVLYAWYRLLWFVA